MKKCPVCNKAVEWQGNEHRPFCSERCKLIDFGGWVNEEYAVPTEEAPPFEEMDGQPLTSGDGSGRPSGS